VTSVSKAMARPSEPGRHGQPSVCIRPEARAGEAVRAAPQAHCAEAVDSHRARRVETVVAGILAAVCRRWISIGNYMRNSAFRVSIQGGFGRTG